MTGETFNAFHLNYFTFKIHLRKDGLSRAEALLRECVVKSERGKVKIDKCRGYIEEAIAEFDETYRKYSGR